MICGATGVLLIAGHIIEGSTATHAGHLQAECAECNGRKAGLKAAALMRERGW